MKKMLFLALLMTLLLLLAASTALAASPSDYTCPSCGNPCDGWFTLGNDGFDWHAPMCTSCGRLANGGRERCTPADGTATCVSPPICSVCSYAMSTEYDPDPDAHLMGEWGGYDKTQHYRYCLNLCGTVEYADHTGGTATCYSQALCATCGDYYGDYSDVHSGMTAWKYLNETQHYSFCEDCMTQDSHQYAYHTGGTAVCESGPICELCKTAYGKSLGGHDWDEWKSGGDGTHTRTCQNDAAHTETGDCEWDDWILLDGRYHERRCGVCHTQELGEHTGGTATCSQPAACEVCGAGYGSPDYSGLTGHPDPTIEVLIPSCLIDGYYRIICDEPGCSAPFTEFILPAYGQHLYLDWMPVGDDAHTADCAICGESATVLCTIFTADGFAACPVCGEYEGGTLPVLLAREDLALPIGTLVVRGMADPVDGVLYAITVAGVYGGEVMPMHGTVTVTVPMGLTDFRIVGMDGTDVPFTLESGLLTIETDTARLFLLVSAN